VVVAEASVAAVAAAGVPAVGAAVVAGGRAVEAAAAVARAGNLAGRDSKRIFFPNGFTTRDVS
jgi:hypothetical protein